MSKVEKLNVPELIEYLDRAREEIYTLAVEGKDEAGFLWTITEAVNSAEMQLVFDGDIHLNFKYVIDFNRGNPKNQVRVVLKDLENYLKSGFCAQKKVSISIRVD